MTNITDSAWPVPPTWAWTTTGEIAEVVGGGTPSTKDADNFERGTIAWITPADLSGYREKTISHGRRFITESGLATSGARVMPAGAVLFTSRAPIGYVAIAANPVCTNQGFKSFVLAEGLCSDYIYFYLQRAKDMAVALSSGTTFAELSGRRAKEIPVPVAPLAEQHRIVAAIEEQFTRLDAAVAALARMRANLRRYRAAVLDAAVSGRLVATESGRQCGWIEATLGSLTARSEYGTSVKCTYGGAGVPVLRIPNVVRGKVELDDLKRSTVDLKLEPDDTLRAGDLLVCRTNGSVDLVGRSAVVGNLPPAPHYFASYLLRFRLNDAVLPQWVQVYLEGAGRRFVVRNAASSAGQHNLSLRTLHSMPIPVPPIAEQHRIVAEVERRLSLVEQMESAVESAERRAAGMRRSILKRAFEGKLVAQCADDEPAEVLLERIQAERAGAQTNGNGRVARPRRKARMTNNHSQQIVQKLWNFCSVLRDDGLSYLDYIEQLTYLLFLKMAHEQTQPPYGRPASIPAGFDWPSLAARDGDELETHYRHVLETLGKEPGMLGIIFRKAQNKIQDPAKLRRLIVDLIGQEQWSSLEADVKGDAYEGLLAKNAEDLKSGAGQYFTPRALIEAIVECVRPQPGETISDPACGTGGFLLLAHDYLVAHNEHLDPDQRRHLRLDALRGADIVDSVVRLCAMNLFLHGIGPTTAGGEAPVDKADSLATDPGSRFDVVLTNPPFGRKSSILIVNSEGESEREDLTVVRDDFWVTTSNKQLNFVQHIKTLLKINGRAAVVVPDNVLFEGGAGETVRRKLLHECDVHTLLRLPTGIFYSQGVKANVLFFDKRPASANAHTNTLWIYDFRTNVHMTLKTNPLQRADLDEFVACYHAENRHDRMPTWSEEHPDGRWRAFGCDEVMQRDKANLDIFWLRDESLEDSSDLPEPDEIAAEIIEDLGTALAQFELIKADLSPATES